MVTTNAEFNQKLINVNVGGTKEEFALVTEVVVTGKDDALLREITRT